MTMRFPTAVCVLLVVAGPGLVACDCEELGEGKKPPVAQEPEGKKPVGLAVALAEAARLQKEARDRAEYARALQRAYEAWQAEDIRRARDLLDSVPPDWRGWEWFYL